MTITITLEPELEARLAALAARTGRSPTDFAREFFAAGIEDQEDLLAAMEVSARIRRGEEKTRPWSEVRRELGLDD